MDVTASRDIANSVEMVAVLVGNRLRPAVAHRVQVDHAPVRRRLVELVEQLVIRQRPRLDDDVVEGAVRHGAGVHVAECRRDLVVARFRADKLMIRLHGDAAFIETLHEGADLEPHRLHPDGGVLRVQRHIDIVLGEIVDRRQRHIAPGLVMNKNIAFQRRHAGQHVPAADDPGIAVHPVGMRQAAGRDEDVSGASASTVSRSAKWFVRTVTPRRPHSASSQSTMPSRSRRQSSLPARSTCPPSLPAASNRTTSCPRSAQTRAASSPAGPPPTMTIFFFGPSVFPTTCGRLASRAVAGFWMQ